MFKPKKSLKSHIIYIMGETAPLPPWLLLRFLFCIFHIQEFSEQVKSTVPYSFSRRGTS